MLVITPTGLSVFAADIIAFRVIPLYPRKRTFAAHWSMPAPGQKQTWSGCRPYLTGLQSGLLTVGDRLQALTVTNGDPLAPTFDNTAGFPGAYDPADRVQGRCRQFGDILPT